MTYELFKNIYAPITHHIGFIECDVETIASAYVEWMLAINSKAPQDKKAEIFKKEVTGSFDTKIRSLLPLN